MAFYFDAASVKKLMPFGPDFFLINVGYLLIPGTKNPDKQVAQSIFR